MLGGARVALPAPWVCYCHGLVLGRHAHAAASPAQRRKPDPDPAPDNDNGKDTDASHELTALLVANGHHRNDDQATSGQAADEQDRDLKERQLSEGNSEEKEAKEEAAEHEKVNESKEEESEPLLKQEETLVKVVKELTGQDKEFAEQSSAIRTDCIEDSQSEVKGEEREEAPKEEAHESSSDDDSFSSSTGDADSPSECLDHPDDLADDLAEAADEQRAVAVESPEPEELDEPHVELRNKATQTTENKHLVLNGSCNHFFWIEKMAAQAKDAADQNFDYMFKLLIIGNSSVGKTGFLFRYADDSFTSAFVSTVGIDFKVKTVFRQDRRMKLQIWDTAGQERYRTITTAYYRGAMGFILMYDVTNEESFNSVHDWCTQIKTYSWDNAQVVLVGNKCDMEDERVVSFERGRQLAQSLGMEFFETSAKDNINVRAVFERLVDLICAKMADSLDPNADSGTVKGTRLGAGNSNASNCSC